MTIPYWSPEADRMIQAVRGSKNVRALATELRIGIRTLLVRRRELRGSRARREWTTSELRELAQLVGQGVKTRTIAQRLGRSACAITQARSGLSAELVMPRSGPVWFWTAKEISLLSQMLSQDISLKQCAAKLGRSYASVARKACKLRSQTQSLGADLEWRLRGAA